jgi:hypothetical protein
MFITRKFIRYHKVNIAILIFLIAFCIIHMYKPSVVYTKEGGFRPFGVGYSNKTVIPIWIVAILLAIFSYLTVLWYLDF